MNEVIESGWTWNVAALKRRKCEQPHLATGVDPWVTVVIIVIIIVTILVIIIDIIIVIIVIITYMSGPLGDCHRHIHHQSHHHCHY